MNLDMTRRTLLHLAGASSLAAAAAAAARAEEGGSGGGPTFANRTPMRIGMVTIRVRKLDVVADYYRDVLGLAVMERSATGAVLGAGGVKLLVLEARPDAANEARNAAGLYHTAFLMPTRKDLARWLVNAAIHRVPLSGFADHRVSESVYLDDPEGNGIEVYADRDPSLWQWSEGTVTMGTDQLDIDNLVSLTNTNVSDYAKAPDGLRIGHMHLRVGDLAKADGFYRGTLGFDPTRARSGAAFLSSGPLPSPSRSQCLAKCRRRPPRRRGHRPRLVFAGDREGGFVRGKGRAPASGRRPGRVCCWWPRGRRPLGHARAPRQGLSHQAGGDADGCRASLPLHGLQ